MLLLVEQIRCMAGIEKWLSVGDVYADGLLRYASGCAWSGGVAGWLARLTDA
jgi:hypothetical protein